MMLQDRVNKVEKTNEQTSCGIDQRLMKKLSLNRCYISQHTDCFYALFNNSWQELLKSVYEIK